MSDSDHLYVITCLFNHTKTPIRHKLYMDFENYIKSFKRTTLITVELVYGNDNFVVTNSGNPNHIQLCSNDILWYKENLINIAIKALPPTAEKVAWIDADISFSNPRWVEETLFKLEFFDFVQMFSFCDSLGPDGEILQSAPSFVYNWIGGKATPSSRGRSGGAWAARVETLQNIDYLIDWDIVGSSDWYAAFALTNQTAFKKTPCKAKNDIWSEKVQKLIGGNVSYVEGILYHYFHGYPSDRGYTTRGSILIDNEFDPDVDIGYREDGLLYLKTDKPKLRQDLINYFESRNDHE